MSYRMLVGQHVEHNAARFPEKVALIGVGGSQWTYDELNRFSNQVAHSLRATGIEHGQTIGILCDNRPEWVGIYIGIIKLGAIAVPLNYRITPEEIAQNMQDADVRLLFVSGEFAEPLQPHISDIRCIQIDANDPNGLLAFCDGHSDDNISAYVSASDANVILFTGGTTGRAKGVVLSHENLFWNSLDEIIDTHMHENDNTLLVTPLHHSAALNCWLLPHLYLGATATLLKKFSPEAVIKAIAEHNVTNTFTPPTVARDIYLCTDAKSSDLSSFKRWYIGGGILTKQDRLAIHTLIPGIRIFYQYGLTEAGPIVTVLKEEDVARGEGSIGRAFINFEVKILREDLSDAEVGEEGEIAVRSPAVMKGYYKLPDATSDVMHHGWLRTGDTGVMDDEGFVYFRDRLKDMIKTGGLNVYSQEVEQALATHPDVRVVAVIGLPCNKWGEKVVAVVVRHDDATLTEDALISYGKERLAHYKVPKQVIFLPYKDMPINYSGKLIKRDLRTQCLSFAQQDE